ncbi:MAG: class I SAM-dependent methyltransferase [Bacteroidia bacterium]|nr:class I SAM-dependent methyltransferase [Bacteroidia bacterium]
MMSQTEFNDKSYEYAYPEGIQNNYWNWARKRIIYKYIKNLGDGEILDVGCGKGIVTSFLSEQGLHIKGVELGSTTPVGNAEVDIFYNTNALDLDESLRSRIRIITLFDVIEHLPDPVSFISNLKSGFKNAEYFVFTVPARKELWSNFDDFYGHIKRYDMNTVENEMSKSGLQVIRALYFFHFLGLVMWLNKLLFKSRPVSFKALRNPLAIFIHRMIGWCLYCETYFLPGNLPGSSILVIAKRK